MQQSTTIQSSEAEYVWWRRRGTPVALGLRRPAMEALYREVMEGFNALPRRGIEVGGILLGSRNGDTVMIDDFEPVLSEHRLGPSYLLSETDTEGLRESIDWFESGTRANLSVIGFFRSHTRSEFSSTEEDEKLFARHLPEGADIFLVIKPLRQQTALADFFFWEDGRLHEASTPLRFPFDSAAEEGPEEGSEIGAEPGRALQAAEVASAVRPAELAQAAEPAGAVRPAELAQAAEFARAVQGADPARVSQAAEVAPAIQPAKSALGGQTAEVTSAVQPDGPDRGVSQEAAEIQEPSGPKLLDGRTAAPLRFLPNTGDERGEVSNSNGGTLGGRWFWAGSAAALAIMGGLLGHVSAGSSRAVRGPVHSPTSAAAPAPDGERSRSAAPPQTAGLPAASQSNKPSPLGEPLPSKKRREKSHVRRRHSRR